MERQEKALARKAAADRLLYKPLNADPGVRQASGG